MVQSATVFKTAAIAELTVYHGSSHAWTVVGSDQPVIAEAGDDVILPCHFSPRVSAVDMQVRWFRKRPDKLVHLYLNKKDQLSRQDSEYRGRTALHPSALETGDISLHLTNLRHSDTGIYNCLADDGGWDEEGQTELIVTALGTQPSISMDSTQGEQTRLVCRSEGWSPEPELIWRDRDGNDVTSLFNTTVQRDSQGFLSVSSCIKIKQQSNVFSCLVRRKTPKPDWESKLHISTLGTQPSISMDSTQGEQTRLVCRSEGWSPEPEVIWRDRDGNNVTSLSNTTVQRDSQGFLSVSSYIKIKQQSNVFSCLVRTMERKLEPMGK
ncbi:UNVERIFIED_CONTAM: hypothetical protein FKN15_035986 [Acipenser sinensis]